MYFYVKISALEIMKKHGKKEHFYQFTPAMMQAIPRKMVQALIGQGRNLSPAKLIPALVLYDQGDSDPQASETVRYLEYCVQDLQCKDQAIHNYLLALYARLNPEKLMQYLAIQGSEKFTKSCTIVLKNNKKMYYQNILILIHKNQVKTSLWLTTMPTTR